MTIRMEKFIDREQELETLKDEYAVQDSRRNFLFDHLPIRKNRGS